MSVLNNNEIKSKITDLWNQFWSGGISNPLSAIEQISYLLFMRRIDELDTNKIRQAEWSGEPYTSKFEGVFYLNQKDEDEKKNAINREDMRWSKFKMLEAEEMLRVVSGQVMPFLKQLNGKTSHFTKHIKDAALIIQKPALLVSAVRLIDEIYVEINKEVEENGQTFFDIQGDVYEYLLKAIATSGKNGQFRTPRHIIKLIAELVKPQYDQKIGDPACGTGGFLLGAYEYIITELAKKSGNKNVTESIAEDEDGFFRTTTTGMLTQENYDDINKSLVGFDIDVTMVRLGLMNLMMHGIEDPHIDYSDSLSKKHTDPDGTYDVVMANPPFSGNIDSQDKSEDLNIQTTKSELLFLSKIYNMLSNGGTAGVIVPSGVLFGASNAYVATREKLIKSCELKAVINMPSGVFKPYAGVSTAILIFIKGGITKNVWFYDMKSDGYSLDDKKVKLESSDLKDIVNRFNSLKTEKNRTRFDQSFLVPVEEIAATGNYDLSLNKYKKVEQEQIIYDNPQKTIAGIIAQQEEYTKALLELQKMIEDAVK